MSGDGERGLSRPGGSGMEESCEGAKPLLSQCLQMVWHLDVSKAAVVAAVSFVSSGVDVLKGFLDHSELRRGSQLRPEGVPQRRFSEDSEPGAKQANEQLASQIKAEIKYFYFLINKPLKSGVNLPDIFRL